MMRGRERGRVRNGGEEDDTSLTSFSSCFPSFLPSSYPCFYYFLPPHMHLSHLFLIPSPSVSFHSSVTLFLLSLPSFTLSISFLLPFYRHSSLPSSLFLSFPWLYPLPPSSHSFLAFCCLPSPSTSGKPPPTLPALSSGWDSSSRRPSRVKTHL